MSIPFYTFVIVSSKYLADFTFLELVHEENNQFLSENVCVLQLTLHIASIKFHKPSLPQFDNLSRSSYGVWQSEVVEIVW